MVLRDITVLPVSPERAFAFFEAMDRHCRAWHPDHLAFRWVEGQGVAVGTVFGFRERIGAEAMEKAARCRAVEPGRYLAFAPVSRLLRLLLPRRSFRLDPVGGGTRLLGAGAPPD